MSNKIIGAVEYHRVAYVTREEIQAVVHLHKISNSHIESKKRHSFIRNQSTKLCGERHTILSLVAEPEGGDVRRDRDSPHLVCVGPRQVDENTVIRTGHSNRIPVCRVQKSIRNAREFRV